VVRDFHGGEDAYWGYLLKTGAICSPLLQNWIKYIHGALLQKTGTETVLRCLENRSQISMLGRLLFDRRSECIYLGYNSAPVHITTSSIRPTPKFRISSVVISSPPVCIKRTRKGIKEKKLCSSICFYSRNSGRFWFKFCTSVVVLQATPKSAF